MHIEYAADALIRLEAIKVNTPAAVVAAYITEREMLALASTLGGVTADIAATVKATVAAGSRSFKKVTDKQRFALAFALLEKFGTACAVYAAAYGVSEDEFLANAGK
jgi:hypothetical protein